MEFLKIASAEMSMPFPSHALCTNEEFSVRDMCPPPTPFNKTPCACQWHDSTMRQGELDYLLVKCVVVHAYTSQNSGLSQMYKILSLIGRGLGMGLRTLRLGYDPMPI